MKNKSYTGKALVKPDTTWRYKGLVLDIVAINLTYRDCEPIFPEGTREFKLSLAGTQWFEEQKYTFIPETDLEILELKEDITARTYNHTDIESLISYMENYKTIQNPRLVVEKWMIENFE